MHSWIFLKDNANEWVTFACDGTGPADESKRTKRVQGWSRLNWLGGILIIVSWHIHFNKLLMPLRSYAALPIRCKVYKVQKTYIHCQSFDSVQTSVGYLAREKYMAIPRHCSHSGRDKFSGFVMSLRKLYKFDCSTIVSLSS